MKLPSVVFLDYVGICEIIWKREKQNDRKMQEGNNVWKITVGVLQSKARTQKYSGLELKKTCWSNKCDCTNHQTGWTINK